MQIVIHLIPYDGIGGVETAARSMVRVSSGDISFRVETIFSQSAAKLRWGTFNPIPFAVTLFRLWQAAPSVLVVSLWRSCIVGVLLKLLRPRLRLVLFLHSPNDVHGPDHFFTRLAARLTCRVWADSHETLTRRLPSLSANKGRVISFVTERVAALPAHAVNPQFVFWGRIHVQKGLERALRIFSGIQQQLPEARFLVIGPDGGDLPRVRNLVSSLGLLDSVQLLDGMDFSQIYTVASEASFYLQTSDLEGMAMSVVEAMQMGLLPVVTPVGEIARYAHHGDNALVVRVEAQAVTDVVALLADDARYQMMRMRAIASWVDEPLYKDSVMDGCRDVLGLVKPKQVR
jgi:glycosyltransferase involved in cell wall biosynthesis